MNERRSGEPLDKPEWGFRVDPSPIPVNDTHLGLLDRMLHQGAKSRALSPTDLCKDSTCA